MLSDLTESSSIYRKQTGKYELIFSNLSSCVFTKCFSRNGLHCHDCFEICFVKSGKGEFFIDGSLIPIGKDCVFIGPPFKEHEIIMKEAPLKIYYMTFQINLTDSKSPECREDFIIDEFLSSQKYVQYGQTHIGVYTDMLERYILNGGSLTIENTVYSMLTDALYSLESKSGEASAEENKIKRIIDSYIYKNINRKITVNELCSCTGLSERSLFYYFKKSVGVSPNDYILTVKISASVGDLRMGVPVKTAALQFGFPDSASFCRTFKKIKGSSPKEFIEKSKIRQ